MLDFTTNEANGVLIIAFEPTDEANYDWQSTQRDWLYKLIESREDPRFAVDLNEVNYLASSEIGFLVTIKRRIDRQKGKVVFFGISVLVVGRAARISPQAMMVAALVTYIVKIVALAFVVSALHGTTAFSTRTLGFTAIGCILVWSTAQVITAVKIKMLYVEPEQRPEQQSAQRGG